MRNAYQNLQQYILRGKNFKTFCLNQKQYKEASSHYFVPHSTEEFSRAIRQGKGDKGCKNWKRKAINRSSRELIIPKYVWST